MNLRILGLAYLIFISNNSFSNDYFKSIQNNDTNNIYHQGLILHLKYVENRSTNFSEKPIKIYVQYLGGVTDILPNKIGKFEISYLSQKEILSKVKTGKSLYLIVLTPILIENNMVKLTIIDANVTYLKGGKLNYGNGGGSTITYTYNCASGMYEVAKLIQGGR